MFSNILPLPVRFDQNEIFVLLTIVIGSFIVYKLPKRFPKILLIFILIEPVVLARICDHILASAQMVGQDLYDILDTGKVDIFDLITYFMYYPFGYMFIYFYDKYKIRGIYFTLYVICWALLSISFEYFAVIFNVFTYKHWNLSYSFVVYLITQPLSVLFFNYVKSQLDKTHFYNT